MALDLVTLCAQNFIHHAIIMAPTLTDVAAVLADVYTTAPALILTDRQRASFLASTERSFRSLPYVCLFVSEDPPFRGWEDLAAYAENTGCLPVYDQHWPSYWTRRDNAMLRAVHDHHHIQAQAGFDFAGELKAFASQAASSESPIHTAILFSEVVLQAAYHHTYGRFPAQRLVSCSADLIHSAVHLGREL